MKSFQLVSLVTLVAILSAVGCSGGGRNNIAGRQCLANWGTIAMKKVASKTWEKGANESAIPAGTYTYQGSDLIYTENGEKGTIIHVQDVAVGGVFKPRINCVRNAGGLDSKNLNIAAVAASKMIAKAGASLDVEAKEVSFRMNEGRLVAESKTLTKPASLEKAYEGKATDLFLGEILPNKVDYEIRSTFSDNTGSYVMSARFKRTN